jgi:tetratricopeptide (TPR) repeat protein
MMGGRRAGNACALGALLLLVSASASADRTPSDRALATQLFQEGRALVKQKKYAEACPKLEESQRLDPGGGTLLNLALCHEALGRTATAWAELSEAVSVARRDRRADREKIASEHMKALEPRLSVLTVVVDAATAPKDLVLRRDGTEVARVVWGTPMPVDPGVHLVEASAPGFEPWSQSVELGPEADKQTLSIPALAALPASPEPAPQPAPLPPPEPVRPPASAAPAPAPLPPPAPAPTPSRVPAYLALGVGVAGVAAGSYFGLRALSKRSDSDAACAPRCTDEAVRLNDQAKTAADLSTIAFAIGAAGLGLGAYLWLDSTPSEPARSGMVTLRGRW